LAEHAEALARSHTLAPDARRGRPFLPRLNDNHRLLLKAQHKFATESRAGKPVSPTAEWLLDNFYVVQEQLREIRQDLSHTYYRELPKLANGPQEGQARVYAIGLELVAHSDSGLDLEVITRFVEAYQRVTPLSMGELWAVAIMLRLALVENLRRLMEQALATHAKRDAADTWADRLLSLSKQPATQLAIDLGDFARSFTEFDPIFVVHLLQRLRDQDPAVAPAINWLEQWLQEQGTTIEAIVRAENQRVTANRVTVGNVITSMRTLATIDWRDFFEATSLVERILRQDPLNIYPAMDFATRDRYRHAVERLANRSDVAEDDVARRAIALAENWPGEGDNAAAADFRRAHIGYYLIDDGLRTLQAEVGYRPDLGERVRAWVLDHATPVYLGAIGLLTACFLFIALIIAARAGANLAALVTLAFLAVLPASALAVDGVNWIVTLGLRPRALPKMAFEHEIPAAGRTMVVVPALISSESGVQRLLDSLEVRYLANQHARLHFAILGDFGDAPQQYMPEDQALLDLAIRGIRELNAAYNHDREDRFYLFHRERVWNEREGVWMGWERKRGKLEEFNRLLRSTPHSDQTTYTVQVGDLSVLPQVRYVITLDADTQLPLNSARRLIGAMAHPLNRPWLDSVTRCVTRGYGIVQPRTGVMAAATAQSWFARVYAGESGLDPYTHAVSDVYQDLFGNGAYVGKAIYDVDAFQATLDGRFPENHLLSHDLIEGAHARVGLASDIELLEDYPSGYDAFAQRRHRWIRGDWQIADWLFPWVPGATGKYVRNPLALIERWKILDNLRRSLTPPSVILLLIAGWLLLPGVAGLWTVMALLPLLFPLFTNLLPSLGMHPAGEPWSAYLLTVARAAGKDIARIVLGISFQLYQAAQSVDAILRVFARRLITKRKLLEWTSAAKAERGQSRTLTDYLLRMWIAPALAFALTLLVASAAIRSLPTALPLLLLWFASPAIAYIVSRPIRRRETPLPDEARRELRVTARRIWRFYETFAGPEDHWLPPDNYQQAPNGVVAHRTSPTNIGFLLLSTLAAYDFGYIGPIELAERLDCVFATLGKLDRYHGHFLNWYNTLTLQPLSPQYVSTVDSGNLAASLIALKQACLDMPQSPAIPPVARRGLADTLAAFRAALQPLVAAADRDDGLSPVRHVTAEAEQWTVRLSESEAAPGDVDAWVELLRKLDGSAQEIQAGLAALEETLSQRDPAATVHTALREAQFWGVRLAQQVRVHYAELETLLPWVFVGIEDQGVPPLRVIREARQALLGAALGALDKTPTLAQLAQNDLVPEGRQAVESRLEAEELPAAEREVLRAWLEQLDAALAASAQAAERLTRRYEALAERAEALVQAMDFRFLFDERRGVFAIGYNATTRQCDNSYYDLFASEARLASFVAIAGGQVPASHWFKMSRPLTRAGLRVALLSWGGTMFEYLMPPLLMRDFERTLLYDTYRAVVEHQMDYATQRHVPWGISEAGFYAFDFQHVYQYKLFGVPALGLKRDLGEDLVVAPYATFLALPIAPQAAWENLQRLAREGASDSYGYYEALDYTASRLPRGQRVGIVRSFMAHHQGMSLVALDNYLNGDVMQRRFHADPAVAATELLLQERIPRHVPVLDAHPEESVYTPARGDELTAPTMRVFTTPHTPVPRTHLLSNGAYTVMLTNAGGGYSVYSQPESDRVQRTDVTRWRQDLTRDPWGAFCYVRDVASDAVWSAGYQPVAREPEAYRVTFAPYKAEFERRDQGIATRAEVFVSAQNNAEVRRIALTNHSTRRRQLEITSYAEVVLAPHNADVAHPAFNKLFVESEFLSARNALLFRRRPRAENQPPIWAVHLLTVEGTRPVGVEYETDRARFLGRGRTTADPEALYRPLSNTVGAVLDPIMSLRVRIQLAPGDTVRLAFVTGVADSREGAVALCDEYSDARDVERALDLAWVHSQIQARHLNVSADDVQLFQRLASRVLYPDDALQAAPEALARNVKGQSGLWPYGISGDVPIVLVRVDDAEELGLVRQMLLAHEFWRMNNFPVDLVILNEHPTTYAEGLQARLQAMIDTSLSRPWLDKPGGVFLRRSDHMATEDQVLLHTVARVVLDGDLGGLADQLELPAQNNSVWGVKPGHKGAGKLRQVHGSAHARPAVQVTPQPHFFNGYGGFSWDEREYVIVLQAGQWTPLPWTNVLANPRFGCIATEAGLGYTWAENSQTNRLTPWSNDPVTDAPGEAIYLRDEDSGEVWSPTPLPMREEEPYIIRHGMGYSVFEHTSRDLAQELLVFVPVDDPVKLMRVKLRNLSSVRRRIALYGYAEWVLGTYREQEQHTLLTELDRVTGALLARNVYKDPALGFDERIAFADVDQAQRSVTTNRAEFLGRNGSPASPAGLAQPRLSGRVGTEIDACAALQTWVELAPGQQAEVVFLLGEAHDRRQARALIHRYRDQAHVQAAFEAVTAHWDALLGTVQVKTPDDALDLLLNRWLLYQALACRVWARSAFYQSGGAYGFRDQLQDVMALVFAAPGVAREHLLRAAAHQFLEGDAQHWWHPPGDGGVRTRFSDDYLWLPFVAHHYVTATDDAGVLDEDVPFLKAPLLEPHQEESYIQSPAHGPSGSLYEHCIRAIDRALTLFGERGLPLMGIGDWNDGMSSVGDEGRGESVWLGWFLYTILTAFAEVADNRADGERAATYRQRAEELRQALDEHAWDGAWYRRAYFDDGTPLGSAQNDECKIDSLSQSWAVLSNAAPQERARTAMQSVEEHLVREEDGVILLLAPPFDQSALEPGYIKGYVPGIRENGGQYTHAALWFILATIRQGNGDRAAELLRLINPVYHASTPEDAARYKVEPYVVAADVYAHPQHTGRGGWTWYTGSASWMYQVALQGLLGLQRRGDTLMIDPCIPRDWSSYQMTYRYGATPYEITVENPHRASRGVAQVELDGAAQASGVIPLVDDGRPHQVRVVLEDSP
jgi:cellobiose phosphorylase